MSRIFLWHTFLRIHGITLIENKILKNQQILLVSNLIFFFLQCAADYTYILFQNILFGLLSTYCDQFFIFPHKDIIIVFFTEINIKISVHSAFSLIAFTKSPNFIKKSIFPKYRSDSTLNELNINANFLTFQDRSYLWILETEISIISLLKYLIHILLTTKFYKEFLENKYQKSYNTIIAASFLQRKHKLKYPNDKF